MALEQPAQPRLAFKLLHALNQWRPVGIVRANQPIANSLIQKLFSKSLLRVLA